MTRTAHLLTAVLLAACSSTSPASSELPACRWPANLNPPESGLATWNVGRALVTCGTCVTEVCVSNDPTGCPGNDAGAVGGGGASNGAGEGCTTPADQSLAPCVDACKPNEYGFTEFNGGGGAPGPDDGGGASQGPSIPSGCYHPSGVPNSTGGPLLCCPCL